jgi:hypothetical protein
MSLVKSVLAADTTINLKPDTGPAAPVTGYSIPSIIVALINFAIVIAALIFFFMLIIGGIRWIASGGDKGQTEAARNQITAALVGLVIVFAAWAIAQLIGNFFGVNIFQLVIPGIK